MSIFSNNDGDDAETEADVCLDTDSAGRIEPTLGFVPKPQPAAEPKVEKIEDTPPAPKKAAVRDDPPPAPKKSKPKLAFGRSLFAQLMAAGVFLVGGWLAAMMIYYTIKYPDPLSVHTEKAQTVRILARDGSLLTEQGRRHPFIPFELIPKHVIEAVVAIEDRRFFEHGGVDFSGMLRAAFANLRAGRYAQGGSTITQQLAKNLYLTPERTLLRKMDEMSLAVWLELRLEKEQILELYLNQVYFGGGAYGIEAAAQRHFGKSARALSLAEGAVIAGLLKAPSRYSPTTNPAAARARGRVVLRSMHAAKFITLAQLDKALYRPVRFSRSKGTDLTRGSGYAIDFILERMPALLSGVSGQIVVETSIDLPLQRHAQKVLSSKLRKFGNKLKAGQGALVILDRFGGVRALVGGADYGKSQYNRATVSLRQPGSTFKPFVYLAALERGMRPETIAEDKPLAIDGWSPKNSNGKYLGKVTLREALAKSINTVAVRLGVDLGPRQVAFVAERAGIKSKLRADPSLALGTSEVSLMELAGAYVPFSNGGRRVEPHVIRRIRTTSGRILFAHDEATDDTAVELRHVGAMNDMLNAALIIGTGRKAALEKHPAAGKTGTSQGFRDAWFVGHTAYLTAGVWLGNDDGTPMKSVVGGSLPADIWREVMREAHANLSPKPLPGTFRPGSRMGEGRKSFIARFKDDARKRHVSSSMSGLTRPPPLPVKRRRTKQAARTHPTESIPSDFVARVDGSGTRQQPRQATARIAKAPPPKVKSARAPSRTAYPNERISPDFIARALEGVPVESPAGSMLARSGGSPGASPNSRPNRNQPGLTRPGNQPRGPYMALGAGALEQSR